MEKFMLKKIGKTFLMILSCSFLFGQKVLTLGIEAPDFRLLDQDGMPHTLLAHRGEYVLLFFYPRDNTPHCTKQAMSFQKQIQELENKKVVVYGISQDSIKSHQYFKNRLNLSYNLLSDPKGNVSKMYQAKGFFMNKRKAFLIGPDGKVFKIYEKIRPVEYGSCVLKDVLVSRRSVTPIARD